MAKFDHPFLPDRDHHADHAAFLAGIEGLKKVRLTFFSKDDGDVLVRKCAPMDFAPSTRTAESSNRYHLWDYESDTRNHTLSLLHTQIRQIELLDEDFDPSEFVTWVTVWKTPRDWGEFS